MPLRATSPLARSDRHAYTAGLPGRTKNLIKKRVHRRLIAILAADVAGYSRLRGADEEGTLAH
jgi:class 3 adenylate cyclase